jgi:hypothetical protein
MDGTLSDIGSGRGSWGDSIIGESEGDREETQKGEENVKNLYRRHKVSVYPSRSRCRILTHGESSGLSVGVG